MVLTCRPWMILALLSAWFAVSNAAMAEACSYREALIAYQQGNKVRGDALMRMAAKDGNERALAYIQVQSSKSTKLLAGVKLDYSKLNHMISRE